MQVCQSVKHSKRSLTSFLRLAPISWLTTSLSKEWGLYLSTKSGMARRTDLTDAHARSTMLDKATAYRFCFLQLLPATRVEGRRLRVRGSCAASPVLHRGQFVLTAARPARARRSGNVHSAARSCLDLESGDTAINDLTTPARSTRHHGRKNHHHSSSSQEPTWN